MLQLGPPAHVSAATSFRAWGRVRGADVQVSPVSISRRHGSLANWVGWVACSDPSAATNAGFPRPATWGCGRATIHSIDMNESSATSRSIGKTVLAGLVVLIAGYVLLKIVIGIAVAVAGTVAVILAIVAIIWALRVLL